MQILTRAIQLAAFALFLAVMFCVYLLLHKNHQPACGSLQRPCANTVQPAEASPNPDHGCAVFGATLPGCQSFPDWTNGSWALPAGVRGVQLLVVGGGGGGAASGDEGRGGAGGGAGQIFASSYGPVSGGYVTIRVGAGGQGAPGYDQAGFDGGVSTFDTLDVMGGQGGKFWGGGDGSSGGGGSGGGTYDDGFGPGSGGGGGMEGSAGSPGEAGGSPAQGVHGSNGGNGAPYPDFTFTHVTVSAGAGGAGGNGTGLSGSGCGGGGGGGAGGVLLSGQGPTATGGQDSSVTTWNCRGNQGFSGGGGTGYGAGGGGGGNFAVGTPGGDGAAGVVYVEW